MPKLSKFHLFSIIIISGITGYSLHKLQSNKVINPYITSEGINECVVRNDSLLCLNGKTYLLEGKIPVSPLGWNRK